MMDFGMIFQGYGRWLEYLAGHKYLCFNARFFLFKVWWNKYPPKWTHFNLANDRWFNKSSEQSRKKSKFLYYITKPLGRCIICNTTWIGFILTLLIVNVNSWIIIIHCLIVGISAASIVILITNYYNKLQRDE
jgi:hypothetical protein